MAKQVTKFLFLFVCCVALVRGHALPLGSACSPTSTCAPLAPSPASNLSVSCCIPASSFSNMVTSNLVSKLSINVTGALNSLYQCTLQSHCLVPTCGANDFGLGNVGNGVCKNGLCCSQAGFCGTTAAYCQNPATVLLETLPVNSNCLASSSSSSSSSSGFALACMSNYSCCYAAPANVSLTTTTTTSTTTSLDNVVTLNTTTVITQKLPPLTCQLTNQCAPTTCGQGQRGNGLCAPQFGCCSQFNFCGFTSAYCSITSISLTQPILFALPSSLSATLLSLIAITTVLCILVIVVLYRYRTSKLIMATSFQFSIITCMGLLIGCACALVLLWEPSDSNNICAMRPWFTVIALYLVLAPMFLKTYRLNRIFGEKLEVVCITAADLYKGLALLIVVPLLLLLSFTAANPNSFTLTTSTTSTATATMEIVSVPGCAYNSIEIGMLAAYMFILIVWGLYMAVRSRDVPPVFNESVHILFVLAFLFVYMSLLLPLQLLLTVDATNVNSAIPSAVVLLRVGGILVAIWVVLVSLFGPKLLRIYTDTHEIDFETRRDWWRNGQARRTTTAPATATTQRNTNATPMTGVEMSKMKSEMETSTASPSQSSSPFQLASSSSSPSSSSPPSPVISPAVVVKKPARIKLSLAHAASNNAQLTRSYQSDESDDDERGRVARHKMMKSQNEKTKTKSNLHVLEAPVDVTVSISTNNNNERQDQSNMMPPPSSAALPPSFSFASYSSSSSSSPLRPPLLESYSSSSSSSSSSSCFSPSSSTSSFPPPPPPPSSDTNAQACRPPPPVRMVSISTTDVILASPLHVHGVQAQHRHHNHPHHDEHQHDNDEHEHDNDHVKRAEQEETDEQTCEQNAQNSSYNVDVNTRPPPPPPNMFLSSQALMMSSVALEAAMRVANKNNRQHPH